MKPNVFSETYCEARAPPVTASSVASVWPSMAPRPTPEQTWWAISLRDGMAVNAQLAQGCVRCHNIPRGECETPKATVASIDRSPHSARNMIEPTCTSQCHNLDSMSSLLSGNVGAFEENDMITCTNACQAVWVCRLPFFSASSRLDCAEASSPPSPSGSLGVCHASCNTQYEK